MNTCAGKLDHYVELQTDSSTQNSYGEDVETWSTLTNVWAARLSNKAAERYTAGQYVGTTTTTWRIRFRSDVDNLQRLVYNSENYGILGVYPEGKNADLILITELIINRGD